MQPLWYAYSRCSVDSGALSSAPEARAVATSAPRSSGTPQMARGPPHAKHSRRVGRFSPPAAQPAAVQYQAGALWLPDAQGVGPGHASRCRLNAPRGCSLPAVSSSPWREWRAAPWKLSAVEDGSKAEAEEEDAEEAAGWALASYAPARSTRASPPAAAEGMEALSSSRAACTAST